MHIEEIRVHGFGKWENRVFGFGKGMNVIVAHNEAGKSTLLEAMIALLYGLKKDYVKRAIKRDEWQRYLPWSTQAYGGRIHYHIGTERYILERDLHHDDHRLYDAELLRELSGDYPMDARKERNYMFEQMGLTRSLFEDITRIGTIGIDHHQQMVEWLHQQVGGNDEVAASYQDVFSLLEQKRREIGKGDTGKETRLAQANAKLKEAKLHLEHTIESMKYLRQLEERSRQLESELQQLHLLSNSVIGADKGIRELQQEKEQALLSKQQMERYLQDLERLHAEEDHVWGRIQHEQHTRGIQRLQQLTEQLHDGRRTLEADMLHCDERIAELDVEMRSAELLSQQSQGQQRAREQSKGKKKGAPFAKGLAYLSALLGLGLFFSLPWYFGAGAWAVALLLFIFSFQSTSIPLRQSSRDDSSVHERFRQMQQEREELYRTRLQLEKKGTQYREQKLLFGQLQQMMERKQKLLQHIQVTREADRHFIEHWKIKSSSDPFDEELMIEAWANRINQIHREIEQLTHTIEVQNQTSREQERLERELAKLQGEMKNYQSISLEEAENHYEHAMKEKEDWERKRSIIDLAGQLFRETIDEWNRMVSPDISQKASELFSILTLGKYDQVRADPSDRFRLRVVEREQHAIRDEVQLSRGTEQQLFLALRLALVDQYSKKMHLPIFLDDSFTHYDDRRLEQALHVLEQFADKHQIFLFSCQSREEQLMNRLNINYHAVSL